MNQIIRNACTNLHPPVPVTFSLILKIVHLPALTLSLSLSTQVHIYYYYICHVLYLLSNSLFPSPPCNPRSNLISDYLFYHFFIVSTQQSCSPLCHVYGVLNLWESYLLKVIKFCTFVNFTTKDC